MGGTILPSGSTSGHNSQRGRSQPDCHPIEAITGLKEALAGAGGGGSLGSATPTAVTTAPASPGTSSLGARQDHTHTIAEATSTVPGVVKLGVGGAQPYDPSGVTPSMVLADLSAHELETTEAHGGIVSRGLLPTFVRDYGAVGDGVTNDTVAIQSAIAACPTGGTVQFEAGKTYVCSSLGTQTKAFTFNGNGASIITTLAGAPLFCFSGSLGTTYSIAAAPIFSNSITTSTPADAGNFAPGDYAVLYGAEVIPKWDTGATSAVGASEVVKVTAVNASTGVVTLETLTSFAYTTSPTIRKMTPVVGACVKNFANIHEVYGGSPYLGYGLGVSCPNIIDFSYTVDAVVEHVQVTGWNVQAVGGTLTDGTKIRDCRFLDPYNPLTAGTSNGIKSIYARNMCVERCIGKNNRHLVDWVACLDSSSSFCVGSCSSAINMPSFLTHGFGSRRIYSFNDMVIGYGGWTFGDETFSADYDIVCVNPVFYGDSGSFGGINVIALTNGVQIINPTMRSENLAIRVSSGAKNVMINGGRLDMGSTVSSRYGVKVVYNTVACGNIAIRGLTIDAPASVFGVYVETAGDVTIQDCKITAGLPYYGQSTVKPTSLLLLNNEMTAVGTPLSCVRIGTGADFSPDGPYRIIGNIFRGNVSDAQVRCIGKAGLWILNNGFYDAATQIALNGVTAVRTIINGGGRIEGNGWSGDVPSAALSFDVNIPASTAGGLWIDRSGNNRWMVGIDSATDGFRVSDYSTGSFVDSPIQISPGTAGPVVFPRNTTTFGTSSSTGSVNCDVRSAPGNVAGFSFSRSSLRWMFRMQGAAETGSDAGSPFEIVARHDDGTALDSPLTITRAAGGLFLIARPVTITTGTNPNAPSASHVTMGNGNIRMGRTTDATSDEAVRGNDTRLTNSRAPTAHAATHAAGASDAVTVSDSQVSTRHPALPGWVSPVVPSSSFGGFPTAPKAPDHRINAATFALGV